MCKIEQRTAREKIIAVSLRLSRRRARRLTMPELALSLFLL
jgi:hypothetical protein